MCYEMRTCRHRRSPADPNTTQADPPQPPALCRTPAFSSPHAGWACLMTHLTAAAHMRSRAHIGLLHRLAGAAS